MIRREYECVQGSTSFAMRQDVPMDGWFDVTKLGCQKVLVCPREGFD